MPITRPLDELSATERLLRRAVVGARSIRRLAEWVARPAEFTPARHSRQQERFPHRWYAAEIPLARCDSDADPRLEAGKRHNVARAAPAFDGLVVASGIPVSFWRALGPATVDTGFVSGMELRGGCIVPAIGGGLCLISNALFRAAAQLDFVISERHGHSAEAVPPGPDEVWGLDATVFYPYVDLRFAPRTGAVRLGMRVDADRLHLVVDGAEPFDAGVELRSEDLGVHPRGADSVRKGRVWRSATRNGEAVTELLVDDEKRLVSSEGRRRSCITCGLTRCPSRVEAVHPPGPGGQR